MILCLKGYKILDLNVKNRVQGQVSLKLNTCVNHKVNFNEAKKICVCVTTAEVRAENCVDFFVSVVLESMFTYDEPDKKAVHSASFKAIFPTVRETVENVTKTIGMRPLTLPDVKMPEDGIHTSGDRFV